MGRRARRHDCDGAVHHNATQFRCEVVGAWRGGHGGEEEGERGATSATERIYIADAPPGAPRTDSDVRAA